MPPFTNLAADHRSRLGVFWRLVDGRVIMGLQRLKTAPKGNGAVAMREICALADHHGLTLTLATSVMKLKPWYESFGFQPTHEFKSAPGYCATFFKRLPN